MTYIAPLLSFAVLIFGVCQINAGSLSKTAASENRETEAAELFPNIMQSSIRCGEVFSSNNSGGIFYNPFEQIQENERCVWVIATPGAVGYTVNVQYLSTHPEPGYREQELILTGVRHGGSDMPILNSQIVDGVGEILVEDSNLLIVTFMSQSRVPSPSTGFVLQFHGIFTGNIEPTSDSSTHHFLQAPAFEFKYPPDGPYVSNELAAIVLLPTDGVYSASSSQVWYKRNSLEERCLDFVSIFRLNPTSDEKWEADGKVCDDLQYHHFYHDDISLVIFQSDASTNYDGFWLYFLNCSP